ncbi:helix-turn-helix transcriptional regulator [Listeria monocytogenes]|uniref:XRE family transcriptional regulator n=1 Tax=Listeria monocytogenes TaxID=1639 RepID=A0A6W3NAJ2_LISMN|nr:helix-turn-helix transcriptional regulator [Listeria monocytogenes]EKO3230153.1 helix-turn-helix transcriptional regulator [Listeria innocua]AVU84844.1 XRE family transcriptional regulator [Listeria monocytogenes]EAA0055129.1 XRE family transcriptional regulator [Listeria monocytogenes]EAA0075316.1 XRE family transcriptional regulator [Listeria monocytogenes]EAA0154484.1 XRE family transcriptional regulator [Listeria monocytogenes]
MFGENLMKLRKANNLTQEELAKKLGVARTTYSSYEQNRRMPDIDVQNKIADLFEVSLDYLHGRTDKKNYWELTGKDERSIQRDLQKMIDDLSNSDAFAYSKEDGEMDENTRQLLIMSLENSLRIAKEESKKRFTPKKYRN